MPGSKGKERESKLWVDIPKIDRVYPSSDDDVLPDFVVPSAANTLVALHGRATWESVEYCLEAARDLLLLLERRAREICDAAEGTGAVAPAAVRAEADTLLNSIATSQIPAVEALLERRLPAALAALDDIFIPTTELAALRRRLVPNLERMAGLGVRLEEFVSRGMRKRLGLFRSSALFKAGELEDWNGSLLEGYRGFDEALGTLEGMCKRGYRFNIAPDGAIRGGVAPGWTADTDSIQEDPQVALDAALARYDYSYHVDMLELAGLGPRRTDSELGAQGAVVLRLGLDGPALVI